MAEQPSEQILTRIHEAAGSYHRLVLIVGPPGSGKTGVLRQLAQDGDFAVINVNLELSSRLLELTVRQRVLQASAVLAEIVAGHAEEIVLLDNLEILFDVSFQLDPLRLLQQLSRKRTLVVAWNGRIDEGYLIYAAPDHPEFRRYPARGLLVAATPGAR